MIRRLALSLALAPITAPAAAQWSPSAGSHLAIAGGASTQDQPKLAPTADGGCYVSWYDSDPAGNPAFGHDVRLQRLDSGGHEQWPHRGVLVADRGFSSTQDYGLDVDGSGNALLAFRDDRGTGVQITAAKVDASGNLVWGAGGVRLTSTTASVAAPKIAATTDGMVVVAWTEGSSARVKKLHGNGVPAWAADVVLTPAAGALAVSDMRASDSGGVIVALQHSNGFTNPRHLYAQKLDAAGAPLWGATPIAVFDGGSLQFGNFPGFVGDGAGGAVFGWYSSSPALECRAQRILANGGEAFPHDGVTASTDTSRVRVSPSVTFDPASQTTTLVYEELNSSQSQAGVAAQRFDATGARTWTPTGTTLVPLGAADIASVTSVPDGSGGVIACWTSAAGFAQARIHAARIASDGSLAIAPFDVSATPATKFRLVAAPSALGFPMLAWRDEGSGDPDVLAQSVLPDGRLGGVARSAVRNGSGVNPACYGSTSRPVIGRVWNAQVAHAPSAASTATFVHVLPAAGPIVPGIGELLVALPAFYLNAVASSGTSDTHALAIPSELRLVGAFLATQAATLDGGVVQLCNAIDVTIGV